MRSDDVCGSVRGWVVAGILGLTVGAAGGLWTVRSSRSQSGATERHPAPGTLATDARRDRAPRAPAASAPSDSAPPPGPSRRPWRDLLLESVAGASAGVGAQSHAERELVATLAADTAARTEVIAEIRALDAAGDLATLARLLSAVGRVPDLRLQRQMLALHPEVSPHAGNLILFAVALDRGRSTPDPAGLLVSTAVGTIGEVAEPELIDDLISLARKEFDGSTEAGVRPNENLLTTLCMSAHRSERANSLLLDLVDREGAIGSVARSTYLMRSQTADARALAVRVLVVESSDAASVSAAIAALARQGVTTAEFESLVAPAMRSGPVPRRVAVIQQVPWLIQPASRGGAPLTQLVLGSLREFRNSERLDVRSAAAVSMAGCVNRSGLGWQGAGVRGHDLLADPGISIDARKVIVTRWAPALFRESADVGVREALLDQSLPVQIREALWAEVESAAESALAKATIRELALEALGREQDADVCRVLRSIADR